MKMLSKRMKGLHPYVPGEQPKDRVYIKLNANENPYPPAKNVAKAVCDFVKNNSNKISLYPDPDSNELHAQIAKMLNSCGGVLCRAEINTSSNYTTTDDTNLLEISSHIKPAKEDKIPFTITEDMIYTGNGSDEVLSFVFYAFFDSDRPLIMPKFTYSFYPVYCGFYDIPMKQIELKNDWTIDSEKMLEEANKTNSSIIFANPNAPTGIGMTREQVKQMLLKAPKDRCFVVDEAYVDFGGESCIPLLQEFKNLLIVRTFSKSLCGAGMRSGYIVANPELIKAVTTVKNSLNHFPMDAITQVAASATCKNVSYYADCAKKIANEREKFSNFLTNHGWSVIPSTTNFVFATKKGVSGIDAYKKIKNDGILVRIFSTPGIENYLRITIGTPEQMRLLENSMKDL